MGLAVVARQRPHLITVMGPTAAGKTDLSLALADALGGEIISVDSALVYRGMDIGTAKPSAAERAQVPHHLIDICDPSTPYSAADFARQARVCIEDILHRGRVPLLVGGTMLYFKALLEGLSPMPEGDPAVRAAIEQEAHSRGWPALHGELARIDPVTAQRLHPNHSQRIARALEVWRVSGRPLSDWQRQPGRGIRSRYHCVELVLAPPQRWVLHQRIEQRLDQMLAAGFVEEVAALYRRGDLTEDLPAIRAVGYRQVWQYLAGKLEHSQMRAQAVAATRQLAKRQLTWLRSWHDPSTHHPKKLPPHWVATTSESGAARPVDEILKEVLNIPGVRTI